MMNLDEFVSEMIAQMGNDPEGFAGAVLRRIEGPQLDAVRSVLMRRAAAEQIDIFKAMGNVDAILEIAGKATRISEGYCALGETFASEAFARFARHLVHKADKRAETVKKYAEEYARIQEEAKRGAN